VTTPGSLFPVVGPGGVQKWWVIPQGIAGVIINRLIGPPALYTVKESTTKPAGAVAGPYTTQGLAQAQADKLNGAAASANPLTSPASNPLTGLNALGDFAQRLTQAQTWVRVGEVVAGLILIYVGLKAQFPQAVNTVTAPVKNTAKGTFQAAKMGLI
jgi:hypothetical protein